MEKKTDGTPVDNPPAVTQEELVAKIAQLEKDKEALVGETKELRSSRQAKEAEIDNLKELVKEAANKNNANPEEDKIKQLIAATLAEKEGARAGSNRKAAFDRFVAQHKEYHPDNDPAGLKRAALERELSGLTAWNTAVEVDELTQVIGKANTYLRGQDTPSQTENNNPYSSTNSTPAAPSSGSSKLDEAEAKLAARNGWTEEKFLKLKESQPDFLEDLLAGVR